MYKLHLRKSAYVEAWAMQAADAASELGGGGSCNSDFDMQRVHALGIEKLSARAQSLIDACPLFKHQVEPLQLCAPASHVRCTSSVS